MSLQKPACLRVGIVSHEFMHALGFVHEQSRYDRDKYITVMWPNIWRGTFRRDKLKSYKMIRNVFLLHIKWFIFFDFPKID